MVVFGMGWGGVHLCSSQKWQKWWHMCRCCGPQSCSSMLEVEVAFHFQARDRQHNCCRTPPTKHLCQGHQLTPPTKQMCRAVHDMSGMPTRKQMAGSLEKDVTPSHKVLPRTHAQWESQRSGWHNCTHWSLSAMPASWLASTLVGKCRTSTQEMNHLPETTGKIDCMQQLSRLCQATWAASATKRSTATKMPTAFSGAVRLFPQSSDMHPNAGSCTVPANNCKSRSAQINCPWLAFCCAPTVHHESNSTFGKRDKSSQLIRPKVRVLVKHMKTMTVEQTWSGLVSHTAHMETNEHWNGWKLLNNQFTSIKMEEQSNCVDAWVQKAWNVIQWTGHQQHRCSKPIVWLMQKQSKIMGDGECAVLADNHESRLVWINCLWLTSLEFCCAHTVQVQTTEMLPLFDLVIPSSLFEMCSWLEFVNWLQRLQLIFAWITVF